MKKILVPTDFSENALAALRYAYQHASVRSYDIDLVHFMLPQAEVSELPNIAGTASQTKIQFARSLAKSSVDALRKNVTLNEGAYIPSITIDVKFNLPTRGVIKWIKKNKNDFIICGTRGKNLGIRDKLFGTVSGGLSQQSICPVLYIPMNYAYGPIQFMGYASNLSFHDPYEIWRALKILSPDNPIVRCFHINKDDHPLEDQYVEEMKDYLEKHNDALQIFFHDIEGEEVDQTLKEVVNEYDLDILVMTKRKQPFFERLLSKSHTRSMLKQIEIPFLVLNDV